ncbi:heme-binding protein [Anaeromicropila herbilytica]|uniref:UPF0303 protein n=1 Tax=Anaeromicropila herbilytica TaxID=2785025 RepID=A0A7R7EL77_9FIRM|nr:heme-binding protein [Anaeromicropila herbilytica]BCN30837.1 UPF0303 protein [Anaeromicropila herbilytica]
MEALDYNKLEKEEAFVLPHFLNKDAYILGNYIAEVAIEKDHPIIVCIEKNGLVVYQYAHDRSSMDNLFWIEKKMNVVKRFSKSSAFVEAKLKKQNITFEDKYGKDDRYIAVPGAVPIKVKNVGVVGVIAVSGLVSESDHQLIMSGLNYLLSVQEGEKV